MPLILLAEDEAPTIDHVRSVLASQGWLVKTVDSRDQALRAASEFAPQLVLVNDRLAGVEDLVRTFSRRSGGPGVVLLSADANGVDNQQHDAQDVDAVLKKPLETESLITTIRDRLAEGQEHKTNSPVAPANKIFTSKEIFGDLLDELLDPDQDVTQPESAATPEPAKQEDQPEVEAAEVEAAELEVEVDLPEPTAELEEEVEAAASVDVSEPEADVTVDEIPVEVAQADSEDELADLEDMVREEVGAWAESVDSTDEAPDEIEAVSVEAAEVEPSEVEPETEIQPEDLGLKPVKDPFLEQEEAEAAAASAMVDDEIDLVEDLAEAMVSEIEEASGVFDPVVEEEDLDSNLEDTLAGVLAAALTEASSSTVDSTEADEVSVDALLSNALGDLNLIGSAPTSPATTKKEKKSKKTAEAAKEPAEERADAAESSEAQSEAEAQDDGQEFGDYTLEKKIGLGGMAEVWKARRKGVEGFQKRVAIKKILPQAAENEAFVEMFIDEAKLAAQLNHNNIVHIYDLGRLGEDYYIAMEYVDGKNLRQTLTAGRKKGQPIPEGIALYIAARLADALDYAHRSKDFNDDDLGLVHRDVSPQNVLISVDGDIKLCDFGIAKAVSKMSTTQMGALKGKLQYMSPEQAWGKSIDHRSDIFSLGTLLFEMLTNERLFAGDSEISVLETVRECDVASRIIQSSAISAGVKGLLLRALAKEPESRFDRASELQAGLEEILAEHSPTPGQKEIAAYMSLLLGEASEIDPQAIADSDGGSEPEGDGSSADVADAEWVGQPSEFEESAAGDDEQRKQAWLKKLLTKLLPVLLLAILGGVLAFAWTRQDSPQPVPSASAARAPTVESDFSVQTASLPQPQAQSQPQPQPTPVESQPTNIEVAQIEVTSAPAARAEPETSSLAAPALEESTDGELAPRESTEAESTSTATPQAASPVASDATTASEASPGTSPEVDPDLERRVEEDLQRVQELISSSPFEADEFEGNEPPAPIDLPSDTPETPAPVDSAPQLISFERPDYTPSEGGDPAEGTVNLSLLVNEAGQVIESLLVDGLPQYSGLDTAVLEAARSATFEAAIRDGEPVPMWYELSVRYER